MDKERVISDINGLLPSRGLDLNGDMDERQEHLKNTVDEREREMTGREIAAMKMREKRRLEAEKLKLEKGVPIGRTELQHQRIQEQEAKVELLKSIEAEETNVTRIARDTLSKTRAGHQLLQMQGTTRPEITKLLTELNINLSVQLTKNDTANLLACLLTCNETQLNALQANKKVPIAIKVVIKRLLEDANLGNIATLEKLWDRVFGKAAMSLDLPQDAQVANGIIPNTPISREAYIVIRDTLIK